jgi:proteasome lid subunit RPN8/RPN11
MFLNDSHKEIIKVQASGDYPNEICGLIVQKGDELTISPCINSHQNKAYNFSISYNDYLKAESLGKIIAVYHSHTRACEDSRKFSLFDIQQSENHNLIYVIYHALYDEFYFYYPKQRAIPYLTRDYVFGHIDCFTLIQDYYRNELKIEIPNITHPYRYIEDKAAHPENSKIHNILEDFYLSNGFKIVTNLQKHDVILTNTLHVKSAIHNMIYLGDEMVLHHPQKRKSLIEKYNGFMQRHTVCVMRHNSLI